MCLGWAKRWDVSWGKKEMGDRLGIPSVAREKGTGTRKEILEMGDFNWHYMCLVEQRNGTGMFL